MIQIKQVIPIVEASIKETIACRKVIFKNKFKINLKKIEIEITSKCNLNCQKCDRGCGQFPSQNEMSLSQVEAFVTDSINLNWKWDHINILGGEPTLHSNLFEIITLLKRYKNLNPKCSFSLATNGLTKQTKRIIRQIPNWINIRNSFKQNQNQKFVNFYVAPKDTKNHETNNYENLCWIAELCGIGLSTQGFFTCGCSAAINRIFGFDYQIKRLSQISKKKLLKNQKELCSLCGHFNQNNFLKSKLNRTYDLKMSKTWSSELQKQQL